MSFAAKIAVGRSVRSSSAARGVVGLLLVEAADGDQLRVDGTPASASASS